MSKLILLPISTIFIAWLVARLVLRRAEHWRLVQSPNYRSSHVLPTPNGGGIGVVVATLCSGWLLLYAEPGTRWVLVLSLPLAISGLIDDVRHLPAGVRFGVQVPVVAGLMLLLGDLPDMGVVRGMLLSGMMLVAGLWWINLFNFMDGIDGIAGVQAVSMLSMGATLAVWANPGALAAPLWMLMLCTAAAVVGFLLLNWPPARIFMGDVGSTWLGFMIFAVALFTVQAGWLNYVVWVLLAAVFVTDATVTLLTRVLRGERWYEAHRNHAYQRLSRIWTGDDKAGHRSVTLFVLAINTVWLAPLAWLSLAWPEWSVVWLILAYMPLTLGVVLLHAGRPDPV